MEIPLWRKILAPHFELRRRNLLHAFAAEADEIVRRALVDNEMEGGDRTGPIGAGFLGLIDPHENYSRTDFTKTCNARM